MWREDIRLKEEEIHDAYRIAEKEERRGEKRRKEGGREIERAREREREREMALLGPPNYFISVKLSRV